MDRIQPRGATSRLDPAVLGEVRLHGQVHVVEIALRGNAAGISSTRSGSPIDHDATDPWRRRSTTSIRGPIAGSPEGRAFRARRSQIFIVGQRAIVDPLAKAPVGRRREPVRHETTVDLTGDHPGIATASASSSSGNGPTPPSADGSRRNGGEELEIVPCESVAPREPDDRHQSEPHPARLWQRPR